MHDIDKSEQNAANILHNFQVSLAKFSKNILVFNRIKQKITNFYESMAKDKKANITVTQSKLLGLKESCRPNVCRLNGFRSKDFEPLFDYKKLM